RRRARRGLHRRDLLLPARRSLFLGGLFPGRLSRGLVAGELLGQRLCRCSLGLLPALFGGGCLGFLDLLGLLGSKALLLLRLGRGRRLLLFGLVGALGCEPGLCFFSLARLLGGCG